MKIFGIFVLSFTLLISTNAIAGYRHLEGARVKVGESRFFGNSLNQKNLRPRTMRMLRFHISRMCGVFGGQGVRSVRLQSVQQRGRYSKYIGVGYCRKNTGRNIRQSLP